MKLPASRIKKIAVFRALQLGDLLCAIPAVSALRDAYPAAHITLVGLPWAQSLLARFPRYFNAFRPFPGYPGLAEQPADPTAVTRFLADAQGEAFDLVVQLHGDGRVTNPLASLLGGRYTAGFYRAGNYCPDPDLYLEYPTGIHETQRHLRLMAHLGIPIDRAELEFPLYPEDYQSFEKLALPVERKRYVCIHPGSRGEWRQWPPRYFAALGNYCADQGFAVVLTGTAEERKIVESVAKHLRCDAIIAAGKTSLGAAGVLIQHAYALLSNCTGVSHIAAALRTPSVVISMDGEPERWGPLDHQLHRTIDWTRTPDFSLVLDQLKSLMSERLEKG